MLSNIMKKDNSVVIGALGSILVIGGSLWTIGLAIMGNSFYLGFLIAGMLVVIGVLLIASAFKEGKWTAL